MAHKAYIHYEGDKLVTSKRNHTPPNVVCECPKKKDGSYEIDLNVIDIVDEVDELTGEKTGAKKAVINPDKVKQRKSQNTQLERDRKLQRLRDLRKPKLDRADEELKKHQDSDETAVGTYSAWQNYRKALRRITDDYKRSSDSTKGKAALDSYKADMSDFDGWPQEPS